MNAAVLKRFGYKYHLETYSSADSDRSTALSKRVDGGHSVFHWVSVCISQREGRVLVNGNEKSWLLEQKSKHQSLDL